jgi:hypothetical protein
MSASATPVPGGGQVTATPEVDDVLAEPVTDEARIEKQGNLAHVCHTVGARARFVNVWSN